MPIKTLKRVFRREPFSSIWFYIAIIILMLGFCVLHFYLEHFRHVVNPGLLPALEIVCIE